jgi:hypothetical protein
VVGTGNLGMARWRMAFAAGLLLATFSLALFSGSKTLAAPPPYEPNDSTPTAAGPLAINQTYAAALEIPNDKDFFFFYVTAAPSAQVVLAVKNLGGGGAQASNVLPTIVDSLGTSVAGDFAFIGSGESRSTTVTLKAGKYFVEISGSPSSEGAGPAYSFTPGGGDGAFGDYGRIASQCASATASVSAHQAGLERAKAKLQRAVGRLRRARYDGHEARQKARAVYVKAKARVAAKRDALKAATQLRSPWCFIPQ